MKKENLLKSIEKLRKKINELMDPDGKANQQVINTSHKLDDLLNEYEKY